MAWEKVDQSILDLATDSLQDGINSVTASFVASLDVGLSTEMKILIAAQRKNEAVDAPYPGAEPRSDLVEKDGPPVQAPNYMRIIGVKASDHAIAITNR